MGRALELFFRRLDAPIPAQIRYRLLFDGELAAPRERCGGQRRLTVYLAEDYPQAAIDGAEMLNRAGRRVTYGFERGQGAVSKLIIRLSERFTLLDFAVSEPDIEDTLRRVYEQRLSG